MSSLFLSHEDANGDLFEPVTSGEEAEWEGGQAFGIQDETLPDEDEHKNVEKILKVIDSLEQSREHLIAMRDGDVEVSAEAMQALGLRVSIAHNIAGVQEDFPLHVSTESFRTLFGNDNQITLAIEQLDHRIEVLSTEANHFFARFWNNTKEFFGAEMNRIERLKDRLSTLLNDINRAGDFGQGGTVEVKSASALMQNGQFVPEKIIGGLNDFSRNFLGRGRFMDDYLSDLQKSMQVINNTNWEDRDKVAKALASKKLFEVGAPFKETKRGNPEYRNFEWAISDLNHMIIPMPKGLKSLAPEVPYDSYDKADHNYGFAANKAKAKEGGKQMLPRVDSSKLRNMIQNLMRALDSLPSNNDFNATAGRVKKAMEQLSKTNFNLKGHYDELGKWSGDDWAKLGYSVLYPAIMLAAGGAIGAIAVLALRVPTLINWFVSNMSGGTVEGNVMRNTLTNPQSNFVAGALMTSDSVIIDGLFLKKYTNAFENKVTLFFTGVYREAYAVIKSTTDAFIAYAYACIGK